METKPGLRAILPLGKGRVVDRGPTYFKISIGGYTTITIDLGPTMERYDIRDGDLLTLYTEVMIRNSENAG